MTTPETPPVKTPAPLTPDELAEVEGMARSIEPVSPEQMRRPSMSPDKTRILADKVAAAIGRPDETWTGAKLEAAKEFLFAYCDEILSALRSGAEAMEERDRWRETAVGLHFYYPAGTGMHHEEVRRYLSIQDNSSISAADSEQESSSREVQHGAAECVSPAGAFGNVARTNASLRGEGRIATETNSTELLEENRALATFLLEAMSQATELIRERDSLAQRVRDLKVVVDAASGWKTAQEELELSAKAASPSWLMRDAEQDVNVAAQRFWNALSSLTPSTTEKGHD